jgi:ABC-2 type transport system permease protein
MLISQMISLSGLLVLYISIYATGQQMGNYTLPQILLYYVLVTVFNVTWGDGVGMGFEIADEINQGEVVNYLLKPLRYFWSKFFYFLGNNTINVILISPLIIILGYFGRDYYSLPTLAGWPIFIFFLFTALLIDFLIFFTAALAGFWLHRGQGMLYAVLLIVGLLDGSILPLDLFPDWALNIIHYLPFQFLMFVPIQAFSQRISNVPEMLFLALGWLVVLYLFSMFVWQRGVKKFEAVGR